MVLEVRVVLLTSLPAPLLEEAPYGNTMRVLNVIAPVSDLDLLELYYGCNIGIYYALSIEGPF